MNKAIFFLGGMTMLKSYEAITIMVILNGWAKCPNLNVLEWYWWLMMLMN